MLPQAEEEHLALFLRPVAPNALEASCAVHERVGHDVHIGVFQRHKFSPEKCVPFHGSSLSFPRWLARPFTYSLPAVTFLLWQGMEGVVPVSRHPAIENRH